jgi:hypothetical protein
MTSASSTDSVNAMNASNPALPDLIPPSILARADVLVTKSAFLSGMVAPETAAYVSRLLMAFDADYSRIIDRHHTVSECAEGARNLEGQQPS